MSKTRTQNLTLNENLSAKTLQNGCTREEIKQYFLHSYSVYEKLFSVIKYEKSYYTKPEPLRHPLIFYYGHTSCVYTNKLFDKGLIPNRINPQFQSIFAVGVDEMDWDDLNDAHYDWPSVREVTSYRQKVKEVVLSVIDNMSPIINWESDAWVIMMGIEHEKIHLETSSVIIRRLPIEEIQPCIQLVDCPLYTCKLEQNPQNQMKTVPSYKFQWDRQIKNATVYGWDNQFGEKTIDTKAYKSSTMLVSNGEYLEFVQDKGYEKLQFWDEEGKAWLKSVKAKMPLFWALKDGQYTLRTMSKVMALPVDWPAEVNNLEATAFCNWKGKKVGKNYRLPTQDEYFALRALLNKDELDWEHGEVGNINMEYWFSPNPVNLFKTGQFYDIVGNVWQHCSTPIYPFENFEIHPIYEDFTTPTFDGRHYMIKGGSFVSTGNEALKHARYAFRRHFYQFAGFRYVESQNSVWTEEVLDQTDQIVDKFLQIHYLTPKSYPIKVCSIVENYCKNLNQKCLTVGCSVGKIVLELSKYFQFSYGTDYSARFFQMATRLYQKGFLKYKEIDISIEDMDIDRNKIVLYQMNPENPDPKKINDFSVAIFDGLAIKDKRMKKVVNCMKQVVLNKCKIITISTKDRNEISLEELKQIFGNAELIQSWVVGESQAQNFDVTINLYQVQKTI